MQPAVTFPRKNDAIPGAPEQLICSNHILSRAARSGICFKHLATGSSLHISDPNRPRIGSRRVSRMIIENTGGGDTAKRDARSVGRPGGVAVAIDAGIEEAKFLARGGVHA